MIAKTPAALVQKIAEKVDVGPEDVENAYPCTTLQAALLAASLQGIGSYVSTFVFDVSASPYEPQDVRNACAALYNTTPILRTRFLQSKGSFLQAVTTTPLVWSDHKSLEDFLEVDKNRDIQLGAAVANFAWIKDVGAKTYMVWSLHHALYDEWSIKLLFKDLALLLTAPQKAENRPNFSRFVRAQGSVGQEASKDFWRTYLSDVERYRPLGGDGDSVATSKQITSSASLRVRQGSHQISTLAVAAWSIFVAKLSNSDTVVFGNIVNGRTVNVPGILDICGPTMTTVPYVVDISWDQSVNVFLDDLEKTKNDMLPFEQTGLVEYRRTTGTGRFDTLLSIRLAQAAVNTDKDFQPSTVMGRQIRHPCCIYLDVDFDEDQCTLKASFDEQLVDGKNVAGALKGLVSCLQDLVEGSKTHLRDISNNMQLPSLILPNHNDLPDVLNDEQEAIDSSILDRVQKAAKDVSPLQVNTQFGPATTLRELGLDSLSTVVLARRLGREFQISVPFKELTSLRKTLSEIARSLQKIIRGTDQAQVSKLDLLNLAEKYIKDFNVAQSPTKGQTDRRGILLTGASGYVGIEILRQLLPFCSDRIILLVRCGSPNEGLERIRQTAKQARWIESDLKSLEDRVEIWPADLGAPKLGLNDRNIDQFEAIRTIVHNGARVDFSMDYNDLEATNVSATAFLLSQHLKTVLSPSFVYVTGGRGCPLDAKEPLEATASKLAGSGGYAQSKFVSEVLLHRVQDLCRDAGRSSSMAIVHPGAVMGSQGTGVANTDDFVWRYVAASVRMQCYVPAVPTKREWMNLMPVNAVAREIVAAVGAPCTEKVDRRLMRSGLPVADFWETVVKTLDSSYTLKSISEWEWLRRLEGELDREGPNHPLFSLSQLLFQGLLKGIGGTGLRTSQMPTEEATYATRDAVVANVRYLNKIGYFAQQRQEGLAEDIFVRTKR